MTVSSFWWFMFVKQVHVQCLFWNKSNPIFTDDSWLNMRCWPILISRPTNYIVEKMLVLHGLFVMLSLPTYLSNVSNIFIQLVPIGFITILNNDNSPNLVTAYNIWGSYLWYQSMFNVCIESNQTQSLPVSHSLICCVGL